MLHPAVKRYAGRLRSLWVEVTSSEDVCTGLCLLRHSRGWLYVRQEYDLVYRRLENAFADKYVPGVVLTGQGGIGTHTLSLSEASVC